MLNCCTPELFEKCIIMLLNSNRRNFGANFCQFATKRILKNGKNNNELKAFNINILHLPIPAARDITLSTV